VANPSGSTAKMKDCKHFGVYDNTYIYVWMPRKTCRKSLGLILSYEQKENKYFKTNVFWFFRDENIGGALVMIR
jgi:hypothetical protein